MFPKIKASKQVIRQCLLSLVVTIDCFVTGIGMNYSATLLPQLSRDKSWDVSEDQGTWIASVLILGCLPGTIVGTALVEWIGGRRTYALVALGNGAAWLIIALSAQAWHLLAGRIVQGVAVGVSYPACYCLVGEVVASQHRALLLNIINVGGTLGMLFADVAGALASWRLAAIVGAVLSLLYFGILLRLEDARMEAAVASEQQQEQVTCSTLARREFLLPLCVMGWFSATVVFTGGSSIALYSVSIMERIVSVDEYATTIVIDVVRISAAFVTGALVRCTRMRTIVNGTSILCAICLLTLCAALHWEAACPPLQWVALAAILAFNLFYSVGYVNVSNISLGELFTGPTKAVGTTLSVLLLYGMYFVIAQLLPKMFDRFGSVYTFLIFAACNILGGLGLLLFMPETRNRTDDEIRNNFRNFKLHSKNYDLYHPTHPISS